MRDDGRVLIEIYYLIFIYLRSPKRHQIFPFTLLLPDKNKKKMTFVSFFFILNQFLLVIMKTATTTAVTWAYYFIYYHFNTDPNDVWNKGWTSLRPQSLCMFISTGPAVSLNIHTWHYFLAQLVFRDWFKTRPMAK